MDNGDRIVAEQEKGLWLRPRKIEWEENAFQTMDPAKFDAAFAKFLASPIGRCIFRVLQARRDSNNTATL